METTPHRQEVTTELDTLGDLVSRTLAPYRECIDRVDPMGVISLRPWASRLVERAFGAMINETAGLGHTTSVGLELAPDAEDPGCRLNVTINGRGTIQEALADATSQLGQARLEAEQQGAELTAAHDEEGNTTTVTLGFVFNPR